VRYLELADALRDRIVAGASGALASEAEVGREFGVSRVTVRRALELLRDEGLVTARQGVGWFVAVDPVRQSLGRVTTVEAALEAAGARAERRVLEFAFEPAPPDVAKALDLPVDGEVLRATRLNLADGEPFAVVTVWVAAELGRHLSRAAVERSTFYDLLPLHGVEPHRVVQTITAVAADAATAARLAVTAGAPLLAVRRVTYDRQGDAVIVAEHRYAAHLTALDVEFSCPPNPGARHG
jgi:GntR family transcriptional regulator